MDWMKQGPSFIIVFFSIYTYFSEVFHPIPWLQTQLWCQWIPHKYPSSYFSPMKMPYSIWPTLRHWRIFRPECSHLVLGEKRKGERSVTDICDMSNKWNSSKAQVLGLLFNDIIPSILFTFWYYLYFLKNL